MKPKNKLPQSQTLHIKTQVKKWWLFVVVLFVCFVFQTMIAALQMLETS